MKWMIIPITLLAFAASTAEAASKSDLWEILRRIDGELRHYDQSPRDLDLAAQKLSEALTILRGGSSTDPQACEDFAFEEYRKDGYSNSMAMEMSQAFCQKVTVHGMTMDVVEFFFRHLKEDGYSTGIALDNTIALAQDVTEGDMPCVEKAYGRYKQDGYGARLSLQKSVEHCLR